MSLLDLSHFVFFSRIPFLIFNAFVFCISITAPNAPPSKAEQEAAKVGDLERINASIMPWLPALFQFSFVSLTVMECVAIIRYAFPNTPLSAPTLNSQWTPPFALGWILTVAGALMRRASYRALGKLFTFELSIRKYHALVTDGPYAHVRHPSYTGLILLFSGCYACLLCPGTLMGEWIRRMQPDARKVLGALWAGMWLSGIAGLVRRTKKEDEMLREHFGKEWDRWANRVPARLVPFVL